MIRSEFSSSGECSKMAASMRHALRSLSRTHSLGLLRIEHTGCSRLVTTTTDSANQSNVTENLETKTPAGPSEVEVTLKGEKEKLMKQVDELQDKYKRSLAETENVRRRMKNQIDDTRQFGIQVFCKDMLEVADILGKATQSVPQDLLAKDGHFQTLYEGVIMTDTQLHKVFTKHGLQLIDPKMGEKFDPNIHEAMFQVTLADGMKPGCVADILKKGYKLHSRTLRPAVVGVFKDL